MDDAFDPDDLQVRISELLVATPDDADPLLDPAVGEVLRLLREHIGMDVAFVSEFTDGRRVFRRVSSRPGLDVLAEGQSDPLEDSWCQQVVAGRIPQFVPDVAAEPATAGLKTAVAIGTHLSTPVVLTDGRVYGTLCTFSQAPQPEVTRRDLQRLRHTARLVADKIDASRRAAVARRSGRQA